MSARSSILVVLVTLAALALGAGPALAGTEHVYLGHSFGPGGIGAGSFVNIQGVAVDDATGDVYVYDSGALGGAVYKFDAAGEPASFAALGVDAIEGVGGGNQAENQIAVDSSSAGPAKGDIYVANGEGGQVRIYDSAGTFIGEVNPALASPQSGGEPCGVTVDMAGNVYVGYFSGHVDKYTPIDANPENDVFDSQLEGIYGICNIAADASGALYADDSNEGGNSPVTKYEATQFGLLAPAVGTPLASGRTLTVDLSNGDVYVDQGSEIAQYASAGALLDRFGALSGSSGVAVNGSSGGPASGDVYVANNAAERRIEIFVASVAPAVESESAVEVSSTSATVRARVNPDGADTTYHFEYGPSSSYGRSAPVPDGDLGASGIVQTASQTITGLAPETTYHYRVVAINHIEAAFGPDQVFTTQAANSPPVLPDGRQYEMVSPPNKLGALIGGYESYSGGGLVQAAANGSKITYLAYSPFANPKGNANGSQILSTVDADGDWISQDISTPHVSSTGLPLGTGTEYKAFSQELNAGVLLQDGGTPLAPSVPANTRYLYLSDTGTGGYQPLAPHPEGIGGFMAADPDFSHVVFESAEALTPGAISYSRGSIPLGTNNLYEWSSGRLQQVNVLPDGTTAPGEMGSQFDAFNDAPETLHAVSMDGSRIIWQTAPSGSIYERDMENKTTTPVPGGTFVTASLDGSKVFSYHSTNGTGDLFEYDVATGVSTDLESGGPSSDGSDVSSIPGGLRLLNYSDSQGPGAFVLPGYQGPSRVSPDGRFVVFMSSERLTGYDNTDALSGLSDQEVYEYDSATARLTCVSCDPSGGQPDGGSSIPGATDFAVGDGDYFSRVLSPDGRVFFDSSDALVPHDSNGVQDVYEFEPGGAGSCRVAGGCVSLISSGTSGEASTFLDASADGGDVFFLTTDELVSADYDHSVDVYDAHVCSAGAPCPAVAPAVPPACASSDACKAGPTPQPQTFGPPASATFSGAENPPPTVTAPLAKKAVKQTAKRHKKVKRRPKRPRRSGKGHSTKRSGKRNGKGRK